MTAIRDLRRKLSLGAAKRLLPEGERPYRIWTGAMRGMRVRVDARLSVQPILGIYERAFQRWLREHVAPGAVCVDVGGAEGFFALLMARLAGPDGTVLTLEPGPRGDEIGPNVELNRDQDLAEVRLIRKMVAAAAEGNKTTTVDELVAGGECDRVDVLKVDVDGYELDVLDGAERTLAERRPHVFVEVHSPDLRDGVRQRLERHGYDVTFEDCAWYEYRPIELNAFLYATGTAPRP